MINHQASNLNKLIGGLMLGFWSLPLTAAPLDVTISGDANDQVELETLSPNPDIPGADELTFSLDGGKSAAEAEVVPLNVREAARGAQLSGNTRYGLPLIPNAPFISQMLPPPEDKESQRKALRMPHPPKAETPFWEFRVVDENDNMVYERSGTNFPVPPQSWDGFKDGLFVVDPNRTHVSFIIVHSSGLVLSWPGEASRFMAMRTQRGDDTVIHFSNRVYKKDQASFRDEANLYLEDLARLLAFYPSTWTVTLFEPAQDESLSEARRGLWEKILSQALSRKLAKDKFLIESTPEPEGRVEILMRGTHLKDEPNMHGKIAPPVPHLESSTDWIRVRENEKFMYVEAQHDRLFVPGSAYFRDAALPQLIAALAKVDAERTAPPRMKKGKKLDDRKVVLRSYTERPHDKKRQKKMEDARLTALRTKVLFNLFARERFLP